MDEDFHITRAVKQLFVRGLGIGGLAIVASLGLADRVRATYFHSDCAYAVRFNAGDYIDRAWYYLLDNGQYYYLDRTQYNLLGELGYLLGHPCYPKLFERDFDQAVGFTNRVNTGWFSLDGGQVPISEYAVWSYHFKAGDYFFHILRYVDLLIDKQEFGRNKVLKVNSLCSNDLMGVSVGRQFKSEIVGFRKKCNPFRCEAVFFPPDT